MTKIRLTIIKTINARNENKVGAPYDGDFVGSPQVGKLFYMANVSQGYRQSINMFRTSPVIEVVSKNIFRTKNTTYKWEKLL